MKDHRELGRIFNLFMFSEYSPGCPIWLPNGNLVYSLLSENIRKLNYSNGYVEVRTPIIYKADLFRTSGHWDHYKDNMYQVVGEEEYALKPMNCPIHMEIFRSMQWSYRDLPYRIHDQGVLHRNEVSGAIGGLTRCRSFCQDDAHCFVTPETMEDEIHSLIRMILSVYKSFDMQLSVTLSTRPTGFMGSVEEWDHAEAILSRVVEASPHLQFQVNPGDGAFYGPKLDFTIEDAHGRKWQTATIQLDFQLPKNFGLEYKDANNQPQTPIVIHRAIFGSFERFIAILLEHYQNLPYWLTPVQGIVVPIGLEQHDYCKEVMEQFAPHLRVKIDDSDRPLSMKIAAAEAAKIPDIIVVGKKEKENKTVNLRGLGELYVHRLNDHMVNRSQIWSHP